LKKVILYLYIVLLILIGNARDFPYLPVYSGAGTAEVYKNSIFYIGGGSDWSGNNLFPYIYKLNGNTWTFFASIPDSNVWDVESVLIGDEIFLLGGWPEGAHLIRKFHIPSKKWTYLHSSPNTQSWGITVEYFAGNIYLFNS